MLRLCRRSVRNGPERGGTGGDAAGYRLPSIPGGYEVRARFCWEFRTARRGFDSRRLQVEQPAAFKAPPSENGGCDCIFGTKSGFLRPKKDQTGDGNDMSKTWIGKWKRIGGIEAMWRMRAGAEVPRRAADRSRPSNEPGRWTGRAAP